MKTIDCEQRSDSWFAARSSVPSASNFDRIITPTGKASSQAKTYMYRLIGERLGARAEDYQSEAMIRGQELEAEARETYAFIKGVEVEEIGFCMHDDGFGASPDGKIKGENAYIEIKCGNLSTHVGYLVDNRLPTKYIPQVQGQILVTGAEYVDFISYYPGLDPLIIRVEPDEEYLHKMRDALQKFIAKTNKLTEKLKGTG